MKLHLFVLNMVTRRLETKVLFFTQPDWCHRPGGSAESAKSYSADPHGQCRPGHTQPTWSFRHWVGYHILIPYSPVTIKSPCYDTQQDFPKYESGYV